jgi:hypothetical protein
LKNSVSNNRKRLQRCLDLGTVCRIVILLVPVTLFLNSCSAGLFRGYRHFTGSEITAPESWFPDDSGHYLFTTGIDIMKNHFSGLMVFKATGKDTFRAVMITEVGLKVLDMEIFPDGATRVHYIMEGLNKKALIRTLGNDFSLILMNQLSGLSPKALVDKNTGDMMFRYAVQPKKASYFLKNKSARPYALQQRGWLARQVKADFYGNEASGIDSINVRHQRMGLLINLHRIIEDNDHAAQ